MPLSLHTVSFIGTCTSSKTWLLPDYFCFQCDMLILFSYPLSPLPVPSLSLFILIPLHLPPSPFRLCLWQPLKHWWVLELGLPDRGSLRLSKRNKTLRKYKNLSCNKAFFFNLNSKVFSLARAACAVLLTSIKGVHISGITGNFQTWLMAGQKNIHSAISCREGMCWAGSGLPGCAFQIPFIAIGDSKHCRVRTSQDFVEYS